MAARIDLHFDVGHPRVERFTYTTEAGAPIDTTVAGTTSTFTIATGAPGEVPLVLTGAAGGGAPASGIAHEVGALTVRLSGLEALPGRLTAWYRLELAMPGAARPDLIAEGLVHLNQPPT